MKTIAQEAYKAFTDNQASENYDWENMTATQQNAEMREYTRLKIAAAKEQAENAKEQELQAPIDAENARVEQIAYMKSVGYSGSGTLEDYQRLCSPEKVGTNAANLAVEWYNMASDKLQQFIYLYNLYK